MAVGDIVNVTFTSAIKLENLWDPFVASGPARSAASSFSDVANIAIFDITNEPGEWPEWWEPLAMCPEEGSAQIWRVMISFFADPIGGDIGPCYFWGCEDVSTHTGNFVVALTNMETVGLCSYRYTADTTWEISWDHCIDADGASGSLSVSGAISDCWASAGDLLSVSGTYEGCLHKGTAGNNYITQTLSCSGIDIDESDWEEFFCGGNARGYGEFNVLRWEAVNDFAADDCADGAWGCGITPIEPHICEGHLTDMYLWYRSGKHIFCERKKTCKNDYGIPVRICEGQYPCGEQLNSGELILAYQTPGSQTAWKRSKNLNKTWEEFGVPVDGKYPIQTEANGIQYLVTYTDGVGQVVRRSQTWFSTLLTYTGTTQSALVTAETNAERCGFLKAQSAGRILACAIPSGNVVHEYTSKNDGETWVKV